MNKYVHGIIAAMVTSMNPDETLNEAEIRHHFCTSKSAAWINLSRMFSTSSPT